MPGRAARLPARERTRVRSAPTRIGGAKLKRNLRPGPESRGKFARWALCAAAGAAMATATRASMSQVASQARGVVWRAAMAAAARAEKPMAMPPAGDGGEFAGALHGFADVAEMVGGAGVNGDRRALRGAERTCNTHGVDYARVGARCQVLCIAKNEARSMERVHSKLESLTE